MKYLLTGGGTGGHVYPALAIADAIRQDQPDASFLYVGLRHKLEAWAVPARGYPVSFVTAKPYPRRYSPFLLSSFIIHLAWGMLKALVLLLRFRPHIIICTGGYVSAPIMFGHSLLAKVGLSKAKVFVYEPNAFPGMLNWLVGRGADRIGVAFEEASHKFNIKRVAVVGHPVRQELLEVSSTQARQRLGIAADKQVILAFGGSGGGPGDQ